MHYSINQNSTIIVASQFLYFFWSFSLFLEIIKIISKTCSNNTQKNLSQRTKFPFFLSRNSTQRDLQEAQHNFFSFECVWDINKHFFLFFYFFEAFLSDFWHFITKIPIISNWISPYGTRRRRFEIFLGLKFYNLRKLLSKKCTALRLRLLLDRMSNAHWHEWERTQQISPSSLLLNLHSRSVSLSFFSLSLPLHHLFLHLFFLQPRSSDMLVVGYKNIFLDICVFANTHSDHIQVVQN